MITWQESDIEDYLYENYENVLSPDFHIIGRQVNIGVGIIDLLFFDAHTKSIVVVELKKDTIKDAALTQIMRYIQGVKDYLAATENKYANRVRGILVGTDITDETATALRLVEYGIEYRKLFVNMYIELEEKSFIRKMDSSSYNPAAFHELLDETIDPELLEEGGTDG